jgi:hypothetical protein
MRKTLICCLVAVSLTLPWDVFGQGFVNLNFETTTITPNPYGPGYVATVPGWTWTPGGSPWVYFNSATLDEPGVSLEGTNWYVPAIEGQYSISLQGGTAYAYDTNGASIGQTGQIPLTARSISYWGGALQVTFNGQMLSFSAVSNAPNYTVFTADISAYAGQTGQLLFTAPWRSEAYLDNIQFSSIAIPEPSVLNLFGICAFCLCWLKGRTK